MSAKISYFAKKTDSRTNWPTTQVVIMQKCVTPIHQYPHYRFVLCNDHVVLDPPVTTAAARLM